MPDIFDEARAAVDGERQDEYGDAEYHLVVVGRAWDCLLDVIALREGVGCVGPSDVALMMSVFKIIRECHAHKRDNLIDAAGYLLLAARMSDDAPEVSPKTPPPCGGRSS